MSTTRSIRTPVVAGLAALGVIAIGAGLAAIVAGIVLHQHYAPLHNFCSSSVGQFGQAVTNDGATACANADLGYWAGWALIAIGILCVIWGIRNGIVGSIGIATAPPELLARSVPPATDLGVSLHPARDDVGGVFVVGVTRGSNADRAGLQPGDRLVAIDAEPVSAESVKAVWARAVESTTSGRITLSVGGGPVPRSERVIHVGVLATPDVANQSAINVSPVRVRADDICPICHTALAVSGRLSDHIRIAHPTTHNPGVPLA